MQLVPPQVLSALHCSFPEHVAVGMQLPTSLQALPLAQHPSSPQATPVSPQRATRGSSGSS
jgi:hypothetical protein